MNSMAKSSGGSSEDHEKEDQNEHPPTLVTPLLSSSSSSYHHHLQQRQQQQQQQQRRQFFPPPPYNHHHGEPSNYHKEESWTRVEREQMFDKVVTPSDVGKLNRLVIPKQHAERYFPLDSSTNYKGLLLNFEDRDGKLWRFQYSYWNSSQSYVMTKGWSRFVKEKKLDAGDVVSFQRGVGNTAKDRLFIDWRRRVILNPSTQPPPSSSDHHLSFMFHNQNYIHQCNPLVLQSLPAWRNPEFTLQVPNYTNPNIPRSSRSVNYFEPDFNFQRQQLKMMQRNDDQIKKASGKRLRLFGVNMDCEFSEEEEDDDQDYDHQSPPSYSISTIPYFPLRPYEQETECSKSSSARDFNIISKSTASGVSLDLKM